MEARVAHIAIKGKLNNGTPIRRTRSQSAHGLATGPTPSSTPIDTPIITDNTVTTGDDRVNHHTDLIKAGGQMPPPRVTPKQALGIGDRQHGENGTYHLPHNRKDDWPWLHPTSSIQGDSSEIEPDDV
jgi:hypothetical protein